MAADAVLGMPCGVCSEERPIRHAAAAKPPRAFNFNDLVQLDVMFWTKQEGLEKEGTEKHAALITTDVATRFTVAAMLPSDRIQNFDGELLAQLFSMSWISWAGRKAEIEDDNAGQHRSPAFQQMCEEANMVRVPIPSEAHEKLAPIDLRIQFV